MTRLTRSGRLTVLAMGVVIAVALVVWLGGW
jgi:hypothetical protein